MHQRQVSIAVARATLGDGSNRVCGYVTKQVARNSITRATSPRHSAHLPTSSRSPPLMVPLKLMVVTSWRQCPHQTFASRRWRMWAGIDSQRWRAGGVKSGSDSTPMVQYPAAGVLEEQQQLLLAQRRRDEAKSIVKPRSVLVDGVSQHRPDPCLLGNQHRAADGILQ